MNANHTPGPWELYEATQHHGPYIVTQWGTTVADLYSMSSPEAASIRNGGISYPVHFENAQANAAFIVLAVNSHDALVEALKAARGSIFEDENFADIAAIIDAALAKAGAQ